jgi:hypothetical protein
MVSGLRNALRKVSVILAIVAMLCVSAASVSAAHSHLKEPVDRCSVCSTAHLAARQIAVIQIHHSLELQSFLAPAVNFQRIENLGVLSILTRGPPRSL